MNLNSGLATFELHRFGMQVGSSAVIGGIVGFAAKKIAKLVLIIIGIELGFLQFLEINGVIEVNWVKIESFVTSVQDIIHQGSPPPDLVALISSLSIGGGFVGGFLLGFKRG